MTEEQITRCRWFVMDLDDLSPDALLIDELEARQEEIVEQRPLGAVQIVEHRYDIVTIKPRISEVLPNLRPSLFLDMRVVVFMIET